MTSSNKSKELRMFEALETLTKHESFDSSASFIQRFVSCDLDLNNTQQSIPEGREDVEDSHGSCNTSCDKEYIVIGSDDDSVEEVEETQKGLSEDGRTIGRRRTKSSVNWIDMQGDKENSKGRDSPSVSDDNDDMADVLEVIKKKHGMEFLLLTEMKRALQLQQSQLERERRSYVEEKTVETRQLEADKRRVETQKKNLQTLMTDYHKIKSSKDEYEGRIKDLTKNLTEAKLDMSKRISRWADQQKKLEQRVKVLEEENEALKKQKPVPRKASALKRPPMMLANAVAKPVPVVKPEKRIQFADEINKPKQPISVKASTAASSNGSSTAAGHDWSASDFLGGANIVAHDTDSRSPESQTKEVSLTDCDADETMPSDYVEVFHSCGTITRVTKDGKFTRHIMPNNDIMDEFEDCSMRYYFHELGYSQITYPNGDEVIEYASGIVETRRADGTKMCTFADGVVKLIDGGGAEETYFSDGSIMKIEPGGESIVTWPSGQKEIRTESYVKRIYTNGTVKIMYKDGSEETRYWNGRVRRKNKEGVLIDDTKKKGKPNKVNRTV